MADNLERNKLRQQLDEMVALERETEETLARRLRDAAANPQVADFVRRVQGMVRAQQEALEARLQTIGGGELGSPVTIAPAPSDSPAGPHHGGSVQPVSAALRALYTAFNHVALGYAVLHAVAHRFYDSVGEGNTADLAESHLRRYAAAAQEINQLISEVVIWELGGDGLECRCQCPSCALGVCLCAPHGANTVNQAWGETSPSARGTGILVRLPRSESAAARAGLREGDRIVAVDDQAISSDPDIESIRAMQGAIRKHEPGEEVRLQVLRSSGELLEITLTRP